MRLMAGSRAWHGGASAGSVRGVASAPLSAAEPEVERGPTTIHPTAVVEPGAIVGEGVTIGPYCVVGPHVSLRDGVCLHAHVHVAGHTRIEEGTTVHSFASVGAAPQDRKYRGEPSALLVGRNCTIHNYAHLRARTDRTPDPPRAVTRTLTRTLTPTFTLTLSFTLSLRAGAAARRRVVARRPSARVA